MGGDIMSENMFTTIINDDDQELGFSQEDIENPDKSYYLSSLTISAVVKNLSPVERIVKVNTPFGYQEYLHQWKDESKTYGDGWYPCCHNHVQYKNRYEECPFYGDFQRLINTYGTERVHNAVLKKELSF
jgi:hypothetical protein